MRDFQLRVCISTCKDAVHHRPQLATVKELSDIRFTIQDPQTSLLGVPVWSYGRRAVGSKKPEYFNTVSSRLFNALRRSRRTVLKPRTLRAPSPKSQNLTLTKLMIPVYLIERYAGNHSLPKGRYCVISRNTQIDNASGGQPRSRLLPNGPTT